MNSDEIQTNDIRLMPDNKIVMKIERDRIWVDPDVEVDEAAHQVIKILESYIVNMVQREVAAEREACAKVCELIAINAADNRASECAAAIRARREQ